MNEKIHNQDIQQTRTTHRQSSRSTIQYHHGLPAIQPLKLFKKKEIDCLVNRLELTMHKLDRENQ